MENSDGECKRKASWNKKQGGRKRPMMKVSFAHVKIYV